MASPLAKLGKLIGFPHTGTHTLGNWQSDNAVDIAVPVGTPMIALQDGVVSKVTRHPQGAGRFAGDQITITAGGQSYFYAHGISGVRPGQRVKAGQVIGTSGSANGVAHLHFAVMNGDPRKVIGKAGGGITDAVKGALGGAVGAGSSAVVGAAGGVVGAKGAGIDVPGPGDLAGQIVNGLWGAIAPDAAKAGLYVVLVGGGVMLTVSGVSRALGGPSPIGYAHKMGQAKRRIAIAGLTRKAKAA